MAGGGDCRGTAAGRGRMRRGEGGAQWGEGGATAADGTAAGLGRPILLWSTMSGALW